MAFKTEFVPGVDDGRDLRFRPADPQLARTLTRAQVETFNRDGFVSPLPEASLHSDLLPHGSRANRSTRRRSGLTIRYTAAEVAPLPGEEWYITPSIHCRGAIPERWPNCDRPVGEHPELMAGITGDFDGNPAAPAEPT